MKTLIVDRAFSLGGGKDAHVGDEIHVDDARAAQLCSSSGPPPKCHLKPDAPAPRYADKGPAAETPARVETRVPDKLRHR